MRASEIQKLPTNQNVREYLLEDEKKARKPTYVHIAILDTLENHPELFSVLNGGVVITASDIQHESDALKRANEMILLDASIINGSQTRGVIKDFFKKRNGDTSIDPYVSFQLIITKDPDLVSEISGTRNSQNEVEFLSVVGRRGHLDELGKSMVSHDPTWKIQTSETAREDQKINTYKLVQLLMAIMPTKLAVSDRLEIPQPFSFNKKTSYKARTLCMRQFEEIWTHADDMEKPNHEAYKVCYDFCIEIAPYVWNEYEFWKTTDIFEKNERYGKVFKALYKKEGNWDIPDGIIMPIIASYGVFCTRINSKWKIVLPPRSVRDALAKQAAAYLVDSASKDSSKMGQDPGSYSTLLNTAELVR